MDMQFDTAFEALDPNAQQVLINTAQNYLRSKQTAHPTDIAPMDGGRQGDEQYPAPIDKITLVNTSTNEQATTYDIEISYGGNFDHLSVLLDNAGNVQAQPTD